MRVGPRKVSGSNIPVCPWESLLCPLVVRCLYTLAQSTTDSLYFIDKIEPPVPSGDFSTVPSTLDLPLLFERSASFIVTFPDLLPYSNVASSSSVSGHTETRSPRSLKLLLESPY